jgi:hexosaminidase
MKRSIVFIISVFLLAQAKGQSGPSIIPAPFEYRIYQGSMELPQKMTVSSELSDREWITIFEYFSNEMKKQHNIQLQRVDEGKKANIKFLVRRMPTSGGPAYQLDVNDSGITVQCNYGESAFNAVQTILQLIPPDKAAKKQLAYMNIFDRPRFAYRGVHLDVGRHFFPVAFIKKYIDWLAYHKMNIFHWHLTEDQGWRIEIKKYPKLTSVGAWRNGTIIGRYPGTGNDNIRYGGFYTQDEVRDVVAYAQSRYIEVIPEIEMPGHCSAAIAAYPWLSCFPSKPTAIPANMISKKSIEEQKKGRVKLVQETWGVFDDVYCAGNDSTFKFLQDVIDEVVTLFPSRYFHIGGDECPKTHWKICPKCQQRMKELGLKTEHELQSYFIQRIEKYLNTKNRTIIGWDEILEGGLAPNAIVMSWRGEQGGIDAAKQDHNVIMTPGNPVYFDHSQSENEDSVTIGGYNPIEKVYAYEPIPAALSAEQGKHVLGAQANMWTEYMGNTRKVEYMLFPRIAALAEVLWSPKENRNYDNFQVRLVDQFKRYDNWGVNYSHAYFDLKSKVQPAADNLGVQWSLSSKFKDARIMYMNDISPMMPYDKPVTVAKSHIYTASLVNSSGEKLSQLSQKFTISRTTGKKITLEKEPSKNYPGDGAFTLVNGVINERGLSRSNEFLGFSGDDCVAVIDFADTATISTVTVDLFRQVPSWIWRPLTIEAFVSNDKENWRSVGLTDDYIGPELGTGKMNLSFPSVSTRYLKVVVKNWGIIPDGNAGAGSKAWLFVSEIEAN